MKTGKETSGIETFGGDDGWTRKGKKPGGDTDAGGEGGVYKNAQTGLTALIKKDDRIGLNIAEYLGSKLFEEIEPGSGAKVDLVKWHDDSTTGPGDGSNIYVRSTFLKDYADDMFVDMDNKMDEKDKLSKHFRKESKIKEDGTIELGRPYFMGTREFFSKTITKAFKSQDYQDFDKIAPLSLLMGDFDVHSGNIGVIRKDGEKPRLVRIDYGWAFSNMTNDVHPHSFSKHLPGMGPTNHFREFPKHLKLTPKFVAGLNRAANVDIDKVMDESFVKLEQCYNQEALAKWAKHAMPHIYKDIPIEDIKVEGVKRNLKNIMVARQKSLKEFSLEINLGLVVNKNSNGKYEISSDKREELKNLIRENPEHFEKIAFGTKKIRFRDSKIGQKAKQVLKKEIKALRTELENEEAQMKGKAYDAVTLQSEKSKNIYWAKEKNYNTSGVSRLKIKDSNGETLDALTQITTKTKPHQVTLTDGTTANIDSYSHIVFPKSLKSGAASFSIALKDEKGDNVPAKKDEKGRDTQANSDLCFTAKYNAQGNLIDIKLPTDPKTGKPFPIKFVGDDSNNIGYIEHGGKVYTLPVTKYKYEEMTKTIANNKEEIETNKAIEEVRLFQAKELAEFKAQPSQDAVMLFSRDGAEIPNIDRTRTIGDINGSLKLEIKDSAGTVIASLMESTVSNTSIPLENGTPTKINSYRMMSFPMKLEQPRSAQFSIALKDENGHNMSQGDAIYFTADYNDQGKLIAIDTNPPSQVKFKGNSNVDIGYIERDGKIFTLPVTQGIYNKMKAEIVQNKAQEVAQSKSVISSAKHSPGHGVGHSNGHHPVDPDLAKKAKEMRPHIGSPRPRANTAPGSLPPHKPEVGRS